MKVAIIHDRDDELPEAVKKVAQSLEENGHNVSAIYGDVRVMDRIYDFMPQASESKHLGMIFNMARGIQDGDCFAHLLSMLEIQGIPYAGSSPSAHTLASNKTLSRLILRKHGIPTAEFQVFSSADENMSGITFPATVRPNIKTDLYNFKVVTSQIELRQTIESIIDKFGQQVLVEACVPERRFCIGLLGNNQPETFPYLEIGLGGNADDIQQTGNNKKNEVKKKSHASKLTPKVAKEMVRVAIDTFNALGLRDFARVDLGISDQGKLYVLDVNSMASFNRTDTYVTAAAAAGYKFSSLLNKMIDVASVRFLAHDSLKPAGISHKHAKPKTSENLTSNIQSFLRSRQENIETVLTHLVNTNTHVESTDSINELGRFITKRFNDLGLKHQVFSQNEVGNVLFFDNSESEELDVLLLVNLDNNVPLSRHIYFSRDDYKLYGTGAWSNKGGIAMLFGALQALEFTGMLAKIRIGILITADETLQGRYSKTLVTNIASNSRYVLGLRGGSIDGGIVTSRSGAAVYRCELQLNKFERNEPDLAKTVSLFAALISSWSELTDLDKGIIAIPSRVQIRTNIAELYSYCEAQLSVRVADSNKMDEVDATIRETMNSIIPSSFHIKLDGGLRRPSMYRTESVISLYQMAKQLADTLDINVFEEHRWSSSDISFIDRQIPKLDGMGPTGLLQRGQDEYIFRHSLLERATLLALLLVEFGRKKAS
ncbi:M20/M25/M40 family metallo-hydrolase [bacterium]|nr:M20/M25/M40 family metallo-hydrolase [bacterium]